MQVLANLPASLTTWKYSLWLVHLVFVLVKGMRLARVYIRWFVPSFVISTKLLTLCRNVVIILTKFYSTSVMLDFKWMFNYEYNIHVSFLTKSKCDIKLVIETWTYYVIKYVVRAGGRPVGNQVAPNFNVQTPT